MNDPSRAGQSANKPFGQPAISGPYLATQRPPSAATSYHQQTQPHADLPTTSAPAPLTTHPRIHIERRTQNYWPATLIGILTIATVAGLLWFGTRTPDELPSPPPSHKTTNASSAPKRTPTPGTQAIEVVSEFDDAEAWWEILNVTWDSAGVTIDVKLTATSGTLGYGFFSIDDQEAKRYSPNLHVANALRPGRVSAPNSVRGSVRFDKPRGNTTVILTDRSGTQITALTIKG